ncbi:outer membrane efflux protein [Arcobacter nitrofigilis DSM 7299]|uniref:Outer membrane efflux protein n=1 Tax=Arcobacter nitrofigilis (strain ATCC 33309 / DSM 7299 / CCUG 15893 / LMG 7604 / NCTC 12251 / CI) TaxID=572480 RepID=D5V6G4_ARCNC|nr:TolC family protein [Arcobacter nitrofigilis]ADG94234.1 outer membrane efflux protein [Arcobacter nitrofigilis DSM 7299]
MKIINLVLVLLLYSSYSYGETLKTVVIESLQNSPKIKSLESNSKGNKLYVDEAYGDYLPTLSYEAYIEDKKRINTPYNRSSTTSDQNGSNQQLKLEQTIYNGGLRGAKLEEAKHNYQAKLISNISDTEKVILDTTLAYLDYVKNLELTKLTKNNLEVQNKYLETAFQTEEVSGDKVDRLLVQNKIFTINEKLIELKNSLKNAKSLLNRYYPKEISSGACRPYLIKSVVPRNVNELLEKGIKNNYKVLEEIENIKSQKAVVEQETARFLPTLKFRLLKEIDDSIDSDNVKKNDESARLTLSYNLFNGGKDKAVYERERLFLDESQRKLDDVTSDSKEKLESEYANYTSSNNKIDTIKKHVDKLKEILKIFEDQFDGGTRSFIDVLNQEEELYKKKIELIEEEYNRFTNYYTLLFDLSKLSDTIYLLDDQVCGEIKVDLRVKKEKEATVSNELADLLSGNDNLQVNDNSKAKEENKKEKVNKIFNSLLDDIYNTDRIKNVDLDKVKRNDFQEKVDDKAIRKKKIDDKIDNEIDRLIMEDDNTPVDNKNVKKLEVKSEVKPKGKLENKKPNNIIKVSDLNIKNEFFKNHEKAYTIVLLTGIINKVDENFFVNKYKIEDNTFIYKFKTNGNDYVRVLYGFYNSVKEAELGMDMLNEKMDLKDAYIDNLKRNQFLYNKYKSSWGNKIEQ